MPKRQNNQQSEATTPQQWETVEIKDQKVGDDCFRLGLEKTDECIAIMAYTDENPGALEPLSEEETRLLARCEGTIERHREAFKETVFALCVIWQKRLYRAEFPTFEAYCQQRQGFSAKQGYRLLKSAQLFRQLSPMGDIPLTNERQVRAVLKAPAEKRPEVVEKAVAKAGNQPLTTSHIKAAVEEVCAAKVTEGDPEEADESNHDEATTIAPPLATHAEMAKWAQTAYNLHSDSHRRQELERILHRLRRNLDAYAERESSEALRRAA